MVVTLRRLLAGTALQKLNLLMRMNGLETGLTSALRSLCQYSMQAGCCRGDSARNVASATVSPC